MSYRVLFFTFKSPYPPVDGGKICSWATIKSLIKAGAIVDLVVLSYREDQVKKVLYETAEKEGVRKVYTYAIDATPSIFRILKELPVRFPDRTLRFFDIKVAQELINLISKNGYDFIIFDHLSTGQYFWFLRQEGVNMPPVIYRSHNIESEIWEGLMRVTKNPLLKVFLLQEVPKIRRFERWFTKEVDFVWSLSPDDIKQYQTWGIGRDKLFLIRSALVDLPGPLALPDKPPKQIILQHVGSLSWLPNLYSMQKFFREIFPYLKERYSTLQVKLGGKQSERFDKSREGIYGLGFVDDIKEFIGSSPFFFIPVYVGSGIRIKLLEALAYQRIVITTSKGSQGFEGQNKWHVLIADSPEEWADALDWILYNWDKAISLAKDGRSIIESLYTIDSVSRSIAKFFNR